MLKHRTKNFVLFLLACNILAGCTGNGAPADRQDGLRKPGEVKDSVNQSKISVKLPKTVMALYLVPVDKPPSDLKKAIADAVKRRVNNPVRDITLQFLASPEVEVQLRAKEQLPTIPLDVLSVMGAKPDQLEIMAKSKQFIVIRTLNKPVWPPYHEFAGRAAAGAMASELKSITLDMFVPTVMSSTEALSKLPNDQKPILFTDWVTVVQSSSENGLWMTTIGLGRVGLPELQTKDVPPQLDRAWSLAMTSIAWKIVNQLGKQALSDKKTHFDLPAEIELNESDVAESYHSKITHGGHAKVHIRLDEPKDENDSEFLTIVSPPTEKRPFGEYLVANCAEIFGAQNERVVAAPSDSRAMDEAMAKSRAELPEVRSRFLANKLPSGGQLILKFRVTNGANSEYLWAFPLNWKSPDEIDATCANDCERDQTFRAGSRVKLKLESIVDWAVLVNEQIVEGGRTNKVLDSSDH